LKRFKKDPVYLFHRAFTRQAETTFSFCKEIDIQQMVQKLETKYQAEHERIWQWLEVNDML